MEIETFGPPTFSPQPALDENYLIKLSLISNMDQCFQKAFIPLVSIFPPSMEVNLAKQTLLEAFEAYLTAIRVSDFRKGPKN